MRNNRRAMDVCAQCMARFTKAKSVQKLLPLDKVKQFHTSVVWTVYKRNDTWERKSQRDGDPLQRNE